jgi:hypothetical protein
LSTGVLLNNELAERSRLGTLFREEVLQCQIHKD